MSLYAFENKLINAKAKVSKYKADNEQKEDLNYKVTELQKLFNMITNYYNSLVVIADLVAKERIDFENKRVALLETHLDDSLDLVFAEEGFKSKIRSDYERNNYTAYLALQTRTGKERLPSVSNGKCVQQVISFSVMKSIMECLNCSKGFLDEAFASSDRTNLTKIATLIDTLVKKGMQLILIEHKEEIYKDLPRREIRLYKDRVQGEVVNVQYSDY